MCDYPVLIASNLSYSRVFIVCNSVCCDAIKITFLTNPFRLECGRKSQVNDVRSAASSLRTELRNSVGCRGGGRTIWGVVFHSVCKWRNPSDGGVSYCGRYKARRKKLRHLYRWGSLTTTSAPEIHHGQMRVSYICCRMFSARIRARYIYWMWHHICYKIFHVNGQARDYYYSLPQPLCCLQIQKTWQWKPINGYSSAVQPAVITLLDGTRQVILMPSERIRLYLAC